MKLTGVGDATPSAMSMSDIVAVTDRGDSGDDVGDTVIVINAGFVILPALESTTLDEHLPFWPPTLHDNCAPPAVDINDAAAQASPHARVVMERGARERCPTPRRPRR